MLNRYIVAPLAFAFASHSALAAQVTQPQTARTEVPVRAVMLFSSGVGYFEHAGSVRGESSTELRFSANQINDILKSLVLQDLDGGRVSTITYPSHDPVAKTLRSFQVDITGNPSLADLMNQLRGAKVTVQTQGERLAGTVLGVEMRPKAISGDQTLEVPILNVISGAMIRAVDLQSITSLTLDEPQLQAELEKALVALTQARDQDKKPVTINFAGNGERRVRIGYVVQTPVWKTSYRLLLGERSHGLQGWAIVENQTESDWNNVSLSLVSGRPVSFIMDLYTPLYAPRPTVQQELFTGLQPQLYISGLPVTSVGEALALQQGYDEAKARGSGVGGGGRGASSLPRPMTEQGVVGANTAITADMSSIVSRQERIDAATSVQALATAAQIGELFQYNIGNVTLARQKSAMLPIVTDSVSIDRLSIYNAGVLARHPLNGVRLKNTTGKHLLQGPLTVLEQGSYAGDARIDNVPPGQERLLSYGIDLDIHVDNTKNAQTNAVVAGRIDKGMLTISRKLVASRDYIADNKSDKDKRIIIEHPIRQGWKLVDTRKPEETLPSLYRFEGTVHAKRAATLTVKEEIVTAETIAMHPADVGTLLVYARTGEIAQTVRDAIMKAVELKQAVIETERQIADRTKQITDISQEQARMRENMRTTGATTQYYQRLLTKLNEQESTIERLQTERAALTDRRDAQRKALDDYLGTLTIG
jgi:hypothetical protein